MTFSKSDNQHKKNKKSKKNKLLPLIILETIPLQQKKILIIRSNLKITNLLDKTLEICLEQQKLIYFVLYPK